MASQPKLISTLGSLIALTIASLILVTEGTPVIRGVVDGATGCGGSSVLVSMELTNCTTSPCDVSTGTAYDIAITFLAGESADSVNWLVFFYYPNGGVNRLSDKMAAGAIVDGSSYRIADTATIPDRYNGLDGELSVMIMNGVGGSRMACGIFPVVVAPNP